MDTFKHDLPGHKSKFNLTPQVLINSASLATREREYKGLLDLSSLEKLYSVSFNS